MAVRLLGDPPRNDPKLSSFLQQHLRDTRDIVNLLARQSNNAPGTVVNALDYGVKGDGVTDDSAALSAAITAAGANGTITIPTAVTCIVNSTVTVSSNNVTLRGGGWGTTLKRGSGLTGTMILLTGTGCSIQNIQIDGALVANSSNEISINGANGYVSGVKVVNSKNICVALSSNFSGVMNSWLIGTASGSDATFGVWANSHGKTGNYVTNNIITDMALNGVFIDGTGFRISGNYFARNQVVTSPGGGQVAIATSSTHPSSNWIVSGNVFDVGGAAQTSGIELNGDNGSGTPNNGVVSHNAINAQQFNGMTINDNTGNAGITFVGNTITGTTGGPGLYIGQNVSNVRVVGGALINNSTYGARIRSGASNYSIVGVDLTGNTTAPIQDGGNGGIFSGNFPTTVNVAQTGVVYTVATLPAASSTLKGQWLIVSDATAPTYNGALVGGGAVTVPVWCDGSSWTSH